MIDNDLKLKKNYHSSFSGGCDTGGKTMIGLRLEALSWGSLYHSRIGRGGAGGGGGSGFFLCKGAAKTTEGSG